MHAVALMKSKVAKRVEEASRQDYMAELERANAELRAEPEQSWIEIAEVKEW